VESDENISRGDAQRCADLLSRARGVDSPFREQKLK